MAEYVRGFIITEVVQVHEWFQKCLRDAEATLETAKDSPLEDVAQALVDDLTLAYNDFNTNLKGIAETAAKDAQKYMVEKVKEKHRPSAGNSPPATELVIARPLNTDSGSLEFGWVGLGEVSFLNRMINTHTPGYRSYWRALEYGTGQDGVPSQIGRILLGSFTTAGGGNGTPPASQYAGGGGPHPVFMSKTKLGGATGATIGFGTIGKEDEGKHFIRYASELAGTKWRQDVMELQSRVIDILNDIKL